MYKGNTDNSGKGKIVYNTGIVKGIVRLAVEDVSGVAIKDKKSSKKNTDCIKVEVLSGNINVNVSVEVYYGYSIPDVVYNIQKNIKHSVESMSKYKIGNVDVKVEGVLFSEDKTID
ncbi:putative uncharacterized protein [Acidiphilium sp. CAG:727]|nr:putative uncharacterized protein [Acidiphilium sp. CAG:727]